MARVPQRQTKLNHPPLAYGKHESRWATPFNIIISIVTTLIGLGTIWIGYMQYSLQETQTKLAAEQVAFSQNQAKYEVAQALPIFRVYRKFNKKSHHTSIYACSSQVGLEGSSGFKIRWLARFFRYKIPALEQDVHKTIEVVVEPGNEVVWGTPSPINNEYCAVTSDVYWLPFQKLLNKINPGGKVDVGYYFWLDTLVTVYQRDATGEKHRKHFLFSRGNPIPGEQVTALAGENFIDEYDKAVSLKHKVTIEDDKSDISTVISFFN